MQRILALEMQSLLVVVCMVAWPIRLQEAITIFLYPQAIRILQLQLPMPLILHSQEVIHQWVINQTMRLP